MQTVGIVLNVGRDQTDPFERGFREMEEPIWADLHARGELVMATLEHHRLGALHGPMPTAWRGRCAEAASTRRRRAP